MAVFNYRNLSDVEFEYLCQDVMSRMLDLSLRRFAPGKDGGVDLFSDDSNTLIVQVKHYSNVSNLIAVLRKEIPKVEKLSPKQYYVCCSLSLTPKRVREIHDMFTDYMESDRNIVTAIEIDDFLRRPKNGDILEKHYKLWLESTGVLEKLLDGQLFVDCEVLMADIERDRKLFVRTSLFDKAVKRLRDSKALLIVGDPGVGKTMTSKMLLFHFAAEGYQIRYSSNYSELSALKRTLSADREGKALILIDDCFGQAYMDLCAGQSAELLSLIKYVRVAKNKLLIMNSRITIFREVAERHPDYERALQDRHYGVYVLNMSDMGKLEKAKIFYNHLYTNGVGQEYFEDIRRDCHYRQIIEHNNFNPRIVEFVSSPARLRAMKPAEYFVFIMRNLNDPKEVWRDEFERRIGLADRMLLLTVYSLSDYPSEISLVRRCFEAWVKKTPSLDPTINQFDASLRRLSDGFLRITASEKKRKIGVANPSVNDFLRRHIANTTVEREALLKNALAIEQFERLMNNDDFSAFVFSAFADGRISKMLFKNESKKISFIAYHVAKFKITDARYKDALWAFLHNPYPLLYIYGRACSGPSILKMLISEPFISFYDFVSALGLDELTELFSNKDPDELANLINIFSPVFTGRKRSMFIFASSESMAEAVYDYCGDVDAADHDPDVDSAIHMAQWEAGVDEDDAASIIEDEVRETVEWDIENIIKSLPPDIASARDYMDGVEIAVFGASELVDEYLSDPPGSERDWVANNGDNDNDEIDRMFDRSPT